MSNLRWIVQKNLFNEKGYDELIRTIEQMGFQHTSVKVIPFTTDMEPDVNETEGLVAYGSTSLRKIAIQKKWDPGVFFDYTAFTHPSWVEHWGSHMLNYNAQVLKFRDISFTGTKFIRPIDDLKTFSGHVVYEGQFKEWQDRILWLEATELSPEHLCVVADVIPMIREYRFFVVDGKVVTGSQYKINERVFTNARVDEWIWDYAQARVDEYQPAAGFVIDVAMIPNNELKVIEVNCLNSSGFYACDVSKIVQAVADHYDKR